MQLHRWEGERPTIHLDCIYYDCIYYDCEEQP